MGTVRASPGLTYGIVYSKQIDVMILICLGYMPCCIEVMTAVGSCDIYMIFDFFWKRDTREVRACCFNSFSMVRPLPP